ncbi:Nmad2 family putative nucleotide modification protein [Qipengyuania seohaensis]|uniref:Nmad2 family putative nucleotide modification protein n=1 Tax=Qipengyuania seohaensis TaxID=266951 RepID=UPI000C21CFAA|nr:hypothetical protein [Qipengyuania seohaensis]
MSANKRPRRLYRYVIDHDKGFAPNPFFNVCTLACCKPVIRKGAELGDVIVGYGPAKYDLSGQIIYWMMVDEIMSYDDYWDEPEFEKKRPRTGGSLMLNFGDNIYHHDEATGQWIQEHSFHSDENSLHGGGNLKRDTDRTDRVLIGREYAYWGAKGPRPPNEFKEFVRRGRGQIYNVDCEAKKEAFIAWLQGIPDRGLIHDPADWSRDKKVRMLLDRKPVTC